MSRHDFQIPLVFKHRIVFTRDAFSPGNPALEEVLREGGGRRVLAVIEANVAKAWPSLAADMQSYLDATGLDVRGVDVLPGGETVKKDDALVRRVWELIDSGHIDRHSYLIVVGGGAFLDAVGYAAATAHRGVRLVRFPTTTLSQDDSGVGVKCAINHFGKKNWVGAFAVPFAVVNDFAFLHSQDEETRRAGLIEAVKVSLVKDAAFFDWIEEHAEALAALEPSVLETCVERSALLHARHIAEGGDPFECGSSRPLDFGHWAAHKLEALSGYQLDHARAVSIGMSLDTLYSAKKGLLASEAAERVLRVVELLRLPLYHTAMDLRGPGGKRRVFDGLEEFREHLGGRLTVLLLTAPGKGTDAHEMDETVLEACMVELEERCAARH
ncbi:3-dehydroquinate synthase [Luteolibacter ambystomatis]|uniref:3-dehydroquinate synthase n=1 Tax=Luteolibacter ambystomatis TaxID=2824561 RepID=A0A975G7X9_9BACT|nr:3-dehydroquinate synthase [Luteolibacter ambystomatis]QUE50982.1 3-dehydroquinate synthase [Luteolibacter ambystomatis]